MKKVYLLDYLCYKTDEERLSKTIILVVLVDILKLSL